MEVAGRGEGRVGFESFEETLCNPRIACDFALDERDVALKNHNQVSKAVAASSA